MRVQEQPNVAEISVASKARLARLLAAENITVEHRNVPTAAFDIKNRVLILPMWKDITKEVYDLLVGHEVGHALWTPLDGWHGAISGMGPNFKSFLNVLEDARIEKKVQRKFPGIRRSFTQGYKDLMDRDFFGIKNRDVNTLGLIDRINIHFKAGMAAGVKFTDAEQVYVNRLAKAETWADVESIANDLWELAQDEAETDVDHGPAGDSDGEPGDEDGEGFGPSADEDGDDSGDGAFGDDAPDGESETDDDAPSGSGDGLDDYEDEDDSNGSNDDADTSGSGDADGNSDDDSDSKGTGNAGGDSDSDSDEDDDSSGSESGDGAGKSHGESVNKGKPFSETDTAQRENEETLVDTEAPMIEYVQVPKDEVFNLDSIIIPNDKIFKALMDAATEWNSDSLEMAKADLKTFKNANSKVVNYLAKEFEMRKAADASQRAATSRTGVLNTTVLHSYKWNEDVFKKITNIPDGKSHGLQMYLDWSGSMGSNMQGSLEQTLNLVMFCKKVNIPFDVYAFSDASDRSYYERDENGDRKEPKPRMDKSLLASDDFSFRKDRFNLLHLASSQGKARAYNNMLLGLIMLRGGFNQQGRYGDPTEGINYFPIPPWLGLGGTPLHEAIITAIPLTNRFRAANNLQIVNNIFLTDGEGGWLSKEGSKYNRWGRHTTIIRDRKSGKEWKEDDKQMGALLDILRIRTGSKVVNFYVTNPRPGHFKSEFEQANGTYDRYSRNVSNEAIEAYKTAKADGGIVIENSKLGWDHHYLILGGDALAITAEGLSDDLIGAKKGAIKRAFGKAASNKLRCRVVLRKFTELIAA
jgi:hypothetical protein